MHLLSVFFEGLFSENALLIVVWVGFIECHLYHGMQVKFFIGFARLDSRQSCGLWKEILLSSL